MASPSRGTIRSVIIALCLLCFALPAFAQFRGRGIEVRAVSPLQMVAEPLRIQVLSFLVTNRTDRELRLREEASIPRGWALVFPMTTFSLPAGGATTRLLSFQVPINAAEGNHKIIYTAFESRDPGIRDTEEINVVVLPVEKSDLMVESQPSSLLAGEEYEFSIRLTNSGNTSRLYKTSVKTMDPGSTAFIAPAEVSLEPGEGVSLKITGKLDPDYARSVIGIQVTANAFKEDKISDTQTNTVLIEVVPAVGQKPEPYHILPTTLSMSAVHTSDGGTKPFFEWSGSGTLDEAEEQELSFSFSGPTLNESRNYSQTEEYWLSYSSPVLGFRLGDQAYGISPLTISSSYGRGIGLDLKSLARGRWAAGAFHVRDRFGDEWVDQGFYIEHSLGNDSALRLNVGRMETAATDTEPEYTDDLWSLEARLNIGTNNQLELEYGKSDTNRPAGGDDDAYRGELRGILGDSFAYSFRKLRAGADYWGYYHSYDYTSGSVNFPLTNRLRMGFAASRYEDNLDMRLSESDTATVENLNQVTLEYDLLNGWFVALGYDDFDRADRLLPARYDYSEQSFWLRFGRSLGQFSWSIEPRISDQTDRLTNTSRSVWNARILMSYFPTSNLSISAYWNIGDNDVLGDSYLLRGSTSFGGSISWRLSRQWLINLAYSRSGIRDNGDNESDQLNFSAEYRMKDGQSILLEVITDNSETEYRLTYRLPIGIKTVKRKNIGIFQGRVFDSMNPDAPGLEGVIIRVGREAVATGKDGSFIFPALAPGQYSVYVDPKTIGYGKTTDRKYPISLEIVGGGDPIIMDIGILEGASFRGKVILPAPEKLSGKEGVVGAVNSEEVRTGEVARILVELSRDDETIRRATDGNGEFFFDNIRPGTWNLKFYEAGLPAGFHLETEATTIELKSGETAEFVNKAIQRKRVIQFIDSGTLSSTPSKKTTKSK